MGMVSGFIKSLSKLSMIGRALMLPISLLPAAGLLLAFGDKFHLPLMMNAGGVIFDNLPPSRYLLSTSPSAHCCI